MKVVVTTPTGNIGQRIVTSLLQAEVRPTVIVRNPDKLAEGIRDRLDIVVGDQSDPAVLDAALHGADRFFLLLPPDYASTDPVGSYQRYGTEAAAAIARHGVGQVVHLSSYGAEIGEGFGLIEGLTLNEKLLNDTTASVRHLRAGFFFQNFFFQLGPIAAGQYYSNVNPDQKLAFVDVQDIAQVATGFLLNPEWTGKSAIFLRSGEILTTREAIAQVSAGIGRKVDYVQIPSEGVIESFNATGASETVAELYAQMTSRFNEYDVPSNNTVVGPSNLSAWAFANLRPALLSA